MPEIRHPFPEESACGPRWADVVKKNHMKLTKEGMLTNGNDRCLVTHVEDTLSFQLLQDKDEVHLGGKAHAGVMCPVLSLTVLLDLALWLSAQLTPPHPEWELPPSNHLSSTRSSLRA